MALCDAHATHVAVTDDVIQTRLRDVVNLSGGAGSIAFVPPMGQFWLIDRVTAQVDTGATATLTVYDGAPDPQNIVSGGVAQAGLGSITGAFNPPIEVSQEGVTIGLTGVATLTTVSVGVWYRRRFKKASTPKQDRIFPMQPSDVESSSVIGPPSETEVMPLPAIAIVDDGVREPGIGDVPTEDETYV